MPSTAHILETALLILVAFLVGCVIGAIARRLTLPRAASTQVAEAPVAVATGPQLVVAPTIAPISRTRLTPEQRIAAAAAGSSAKPDAGTVEADKVEAEGAVAPSPVDAGTAPVSTSGPPDMATEFGPAHTPGVATSGREVPAPPADPAATSEPAPPDPAELPADPPVIPLVEPEPASTEVRAEDVPPIDEAAHVVDQPVHSSTVEAAEPEPNAAEGPPTEPAVVEPKRPVEVAVELDTVHESEAQPAFAAASDAAAVELSVPEPTPERAITPEPEPEPEAETEPEPEPEFEPVSPPPSVDDPPPATAEDDEAAAMRAIEGGWTPSAVVAPRQPAPEPELSRSEIEAAMASARNAVASAAAAAQAALADVPDEDPADAATVSNDRLAFEAVEGATTLDNFLAADTAPEPGIDGMDFEPERPRGGFGKPAALAAPRDGGKDNLRQIAGVTPDLEASLNHLGIYHYDQVAGWDHKAVVWLDRHLTLRGRIGREKWIDQARALLVRRPATARPVRR